MEEYIVWIGFSQLVKREEITTEFSNATDEHIVWIGFSQLAKREEITAQNFPM